MSTRLPLVLLIVLVLWTALVGTDQRFTESLHADEQTIASTREDETRLGRGDGNGSMDDHVLDDQPTQVHMGAALDAGLLTDALAVPPACVLWAAYVAAPAERMRAPPYLEGIQRPPSIA